MDEDRIDWSEKKKQLFQLRMYQYMSTVPKRRPVDPPLSNRIIGLARYRGMSIGILSQYAEKEAELILEHWRCLECEFNSDFYDEEDEFEIDELETSVMQEKARKRNIISGVILLLLFVFIVVFILKNITLL